MNRSTLLLPIVAIAIAGILSSIFIVDERQKALVALVVKVLCLTCR